ncbi:perlucin-like protein [Mercenaria mercenaria]|uniref:perlucin-like protein n=1 Tax=Mercenaria mercenaria TaxID=6596 RepID=UPI00234F1252|nr:perlucin-like protein [Mercenaria mercenaria]
MILSRTLAFALLYCYRAFGCPNGWMTHDSSCYHFSHDTEEWASAVAICKILGGHLVEIDDATENLYLVSQAKLLNKSFWIGLNDLQEENSWVWVNSNTPASYTHWHPGQPDNGASNENCAHLYPGFSFSWNDKQCYTHYNYICEKAAEGSEIVG